MDQELNSALERLRELARRQEQEQERLQRVAERLPPGAAGAGGESQRRLAEEAEELARELERLSREYSSPELAQTARELEEAANAMRRSATSRNQNGVGQASAAQEALEEARRLLERDQSNRIGRDAQNAVADAERALEQQREIEEAVGEMPTGLAGRAEALPPVLDRKDQLIEELGNLEGELNRLADEAEDPRAERGFREAASAIRDGQLPDRIDFSKSLVASSRPEQSEEFEAQITELMEELADQVREAAGAIGPDADQAAAEFAERTRELVRAAESMEERARQAAEGQQEGEGQAGGEPSDGEQAGGQQGGGQQPGGQQAGGQQAGGGRFGGNRFGPGGPGGWFDGDIARQLSREAVERRMQAETLRDRLRDAGAPLESLDSLDGVIDRFQRLEALGIYGEPRALAELQRELIESLRELDFDIRRHFAAESLDGPMVVGSGEVPAGYQDLVEEYFRSLAR